MALVLAALVLLAPAARAASSEFEVELTPELRRLAGHGELAPVTRARVTIVAPERLDALPDRPVLIVSATSDPAYHSSRRLLGEYAATALDRGWIALAADPAEEIAAEQDGATLRFVLNYVALAALQTKWPGAAKASLAFAGFSGGAKFSGWLAAAFASQGRRVIGLYLAGINADAVLEAARHFNLLDDAFRRIPVFLQSGEQDEIATPADHRAIYEELQREGFQHVRIEQVAGGHAVDPGPLHEALDWFRAPAPQSAPAR